MVQWMYVIQIICEKIERALGRTFRQLVASFTSAGVIFIGSPFLSLPLSKRVVRRPLILTIFLRRCLWSV